MPNKTVKKTTTTKKSVVSTPKKSNAKKKPEKKLIVPYIKKKKKEKVGTDKKSNNLKKKIISGLLIFGIIIIAMVLLFTLYIILSAPKFNEDLLYRKESTVLYDLNGKEFARLGAENRQLVDYEELPQVLIDAIIATEDSRFFQHNGFDIARFIKASVGQVAGQSGAGGASTLTMQVVKNTFTSTEASGIKGIVRKFTDIYMSIFKVESQYTKEEIIEFYVNAPWLGNGAYGVEQASQTYFGKSVKDLTLAEASLIAGLFQAPGLYNPFINPEGATQRRSTVLSLMVKHGYITQEQKDATEKISVSSLLANNSSSDLNKYQSFVDTVVEEVINDTGNNPYDIPMDIYTTMNPEIQEVLVNLNNGEYYTFANDVVQLAVAITDVNNGSIVAISGGRNQKVERDYNRATMMKTHPGSTAKPIFDYGPLIEYNNASTYQMFLDERTTYSNGTSIKNSDGTYRGLMTMRQALIQSRNIPALRAFKQLNPENVSEFVHNLGINYGDYLYESMSVGGFDGANPLILSSAYAAFGNGGKYIEAYSYTKVIYKSTGETYEQTMKITEAMDPETAYMVTDMLVTASKNGVGGNIKVSGTTVAAKTGTSTYDSNALEAAGVPLSTSRDNWVNAYSPDYSISLWYGYDELSKEYYSSAIQSANATRKIMAELANRVFPKNSKFKKPSGVVEVEVELETYPAQLPSEYTPENLRITELFRSGTEPTEISTRFSKLKNPSNGTYTSSGSVVTLTWDEAPLPDAINTTYLQEHFEKYYEEHSQKYYEKRIAYNNSTFGNFGYRVYLKDASGNLNYLGFTTQNSFTYNTSDNNSIFVVKASYSNFQANMSDGITISATSGGTTTPPTEDPETPPTEDPKPEEVTISSLKVGKTNICVSTGTESYTDEPIYVYNDKKEDVTSKVTIEKKYTFNGTKVNKVDLTTPGTYKIEYIVNKYYNTERTVLVCENGCASDTKCN